MLSSSEVRVSENISEAHAPEMNVAQVSTINSKTDECSVATAIIQKKSLCNLAKGKWKDNHTAYGLYRTKSRL